MAAAHGGVEYLEVEDGLGRVELCQVGQALVLRTPVAFQICGPGQEGGAALVHEGAEGLLDDEVDELLGGVEAAAVLAGVGVEAHFDSAVLQHRLALQEALVDGAELLDGHVAVVDEAAPLGRFGVAEVVEQVGDRRVGEAHPLQDGGGFARKEPAVVGREADGGVAAVDEPAQGHDVVVVVGGGIGEEVVVFHPLRDGVSDALPEAVALVGPVVDGEQAAVFGIEHEQQPVQENQRGVADVREVRGRLAGEGSYESGEHGVEHHVGEVARNLLLITSPFDQGRFKEGCLQPVLGGESICAKQ